MRPCVAQLSPITYWNVRILFILSSLSILKKVGEVRRMRRTLENRGLAESPMRRCSDACDAPSQAFNYSLANIYTVRIPLADLFREL